MKSRLLDLCHSLDPRQRSVAFPSTRDLCVFRKRDRMRLGHSEVRFLNVPWSTIVKITSWTMRADSFPVESVRCHGQLLGPCHPGILRLAQIRLHPMGQQVSCTLAQVLRCVSNRPEPQARIVDSNKQDSDRLKECPDFGEREGEECCEANSRVNRNLRNSCLVILTVERDCG